MREKGFALATVVILLALIATSVLLVTREATTGRERVSRSDSVAAARYVAEAGLAHARWQLAQNTTCTGYKDVPLTPFANGNYSATIAPTSDSPVTLAALGIGPNGTQRSLIHEPFTAYQAMKLSVLKSKSADGDDAYIWEANKTTNYGTDDESWVSYSTNNTSRSLFRFDISTIPAEAKVLGATLSLYHRSGYGVNVPVTAHRITQPWNEDFATWNDRNKLTPWATAGGDFDPSVISTTSVGPVSKRRYEWDLTGLVRDWVEGVYPNYGVALATALSGAFGERFDTSDHVDPARHPSLTIAYACECGKTCNDAPTGKNVLLVVGDPSDLTSEQTDKKALMETWGHTVTLIATSESQTAFDAAATLVDVVYVPELGTTPMNQLGTKADGLEVGVITEEARRALKLGAFSLFPFVNSATIEVTDNSHYITETLSLGTVTLSTEVQSMWVLKPALAPDLHVLGELGSSEPALAYVDIGERLNDSTPAPARRVKLPWGAYDFDINLFTDAARTIMQRAIEWASVDASAPIAHWKLDDAAGTTAVDSQGNHDGTVNGASWTSGRLDGALDFDGSNDYVDVGSFDVVGSGLTLMGWFNADTIPTSDGRIVSKASGPNATDAWWQLSTTDSGSNRYLRMRIKAGGTTTTFADSSVNLSPGQWYFAVATYANGSGEMKLYLDGAQVAGGVHGAGGAVDVDPSVPVAIGANGTPERFFDGVLDDVRVYNRALSDTEIADLYAGGSAPIAHWKLDDGTGPTAVDSEGGHDGTLVGNPAWVAGVLGDALDFDGAGDRVDASSVLEAGSPEMSVTAWVSKRDTGDDRVVCKSSGTAITDHVFCLGLYGTAVRVRLRTTDNGGTSNYDGGSVALDTWTHLAFSYDGSAVRIYEDGVETASHAVTGDVIASALPVVLGSVNMSQDRYLNGMLDDVRIYDRALKATEIADLFSAGGGGGPGCAVTIVEDFESGGYAGGTGPWNGNWVEINETTNPTAGDEQVRSQSGNRAARVRDNDGGGEGILRSADLSAYTSATLLFDYWRSQLDDSVNDYVTVEVFPNGVGEWEEVYRIEGPGNDPGTSPPHSGSADISTFITNDTHFRFITGPNMGPLDAVFLDNIEICGN